MLIFDLDDLLCLWLLKPPYARPGAPALAIRDRTLAEQDFWGDEIEPDTLRGRSPRP